ncbi:hypothetical protein Tco_1555418 [Tanacetum coccineum]
MYNLSRWIGMLHTDFQAGNPTSLEGIQSWSFGDVFDADMVLGTWNLCCHAGLMGIGFTCSILTHGYEHKFITEIIARRANDSIVSITESNYKNLNKNDIEDMYLLIVNGKVDDYGETGLLWSLSVFIRSILISKRVHDFQLGVEIYQQKVNLSTPKITFLGIEKCKVFSIISELVYRIIYKNSKKEKRAMRHQEIHKFCDATLKRVLEGLKNYNNNVKHGYVTSSLSKEDDEYLQLFEEEIEERLKHHNQMRRWEMYVNGRPLGS